MNQGSLRLAAALCTFWIAVSAQAQTATSSAGPYYASPSWDQKLASAARFIVLTNWSSQAVLDRETGLVWQSALTPWDTFGGASQWCLTSTAGGRAGWRLPTIQELFRTVVNGSSGMAQVVDSPFTFMPSRGVRFTVWTSTADAAVGGKVFSVYFDEYGYVAPMSLNSTQSSQVWCVQSPAPGPGAQ